jgi:hypothetical protein
MHELKSEGFPPHLERLLTLLSNVKKSPKGWQASCPFHDDRTPSLSISLGNEGQILVHCFAGCPVESVVEALGVQMKDLFPSDLSASSNQKKNARQSISLLDIAQAKRIPWKFLCNLGIVEERRGLRIPYYTPNGQSAPRYRLRTALTANTTAALKLLGEWLSV